jgi:hypothetical protein
VSQEVGGTRVARLTATVKIVLAVGQADPH